MTTIMRVLKMSVIWLALLAGVSSAAAAPIGVSYTATGSAGNWTLNFSVTNGLLGTDQDIDFFGVLLSAPNVVGSPASYDPTVYTTWTNSGLGGSSILYNNIWVDGSASNLPPGSTLSGFEVQVTDLTVPQSVPWFALATGTIPYGGTDYFGTDPTLPGFEGVASPEPSTWLMLAGGLSGFALFRRRRR